MKGIRIGGLALGMALLGMTTLSAATLDSIRATNGQDHTRVVLSLTDRAPSWDVQYQAAKDTLQLTLPDTVNRLTAPVVYESRREGLLKGVTLREAPQGLVLAIQANQPVMHNVFSLDKPDRLVVDLFTNYSQRTVTNYAKNMTYLRWDRSVPAGRLQMYVMIHTGPGGFQVQKVQGTAGQAVARTQGVSLPITSIPQSPFLTYMPRSYVVPTAQGYTLQFVRPSYEAVIGGKAYPITGVNRERTENSLILYTPAQGLHTGTNAYGEEVVLAQDRVQSHVGNNALLRPGEFILSGHGKMKEMLEAVPNGTPVTIRQRGTIAAPAKGQPIIGVPILDHGVYVGPKRADGEGGRMSRSFLGTTAEGFLVFIVIKGGEGSSVGVTLKEAADVLREIGLQSVVAVGAGDGANLYLDRKPVLVNRNASVTIQEIASMR